MVCFASCFSRQITTYGKEEIYDFVSFRTCLIIFLNVFLLLNLFVLDRSRHFHIIISYLFMVTKRCPNFEDNVIAITSDEVRHIVIFRLSHYLHAIFILA